MTAAQSKDLEGIACEGEYIATMGSDDGDSGTLYSATNIEFRGNDYYIQRQLR